MTDEVSAKLETEVRQVASTLRVSSEGEGKLRTLGRMGKLFVVALPLLLGACLEAVDLVAERVTAPAYCETPTGLALCDADQAGAE